MGVFRLRVFGGVDIADSAGREVRELLAQPKRLALLVFLAMAPPRRFQRREVLLPLFWPELDQEHARNALRQAAHYLRHSLGEGVLLNRGPDEIALNGGRLWCDAAAFEQALGMNDLVGALDLYSGNLLPGFFISGAPEFERWVEDERARLLCRAVQAARALTQRATADGNLMAALHWARTTSRLSPLDEGDVRRVIELVAGTGDRVGAARIYDLFMQRLAVDYDLEPSDQTRALMASVRLGRSPTPEREFRA